MTRALRLKQYGLPRSGTNATKGILLQHFEDLTVYTGLGGSKHGMCACQVASLDVDGLVVTVKDPYAWLHSAWRYSKLAARVRSGGPDLGDFLAKPFIYESMRFSTPVEAWNFLNWHWTHLALLEWSPAPIPWPVLLVRAEELLTREGIDAVVGRLEQAFGRERRPDRPIVPPPWAYSAVGGPRAQAKDHEPVFSGVEFDRGFYLQRRYLADFGFAEASLVEDLVNKELAEELGYKPVAAVAE